MNYADAIRRQAEDAPRAALPAVTAALWRAFGEGHVSEAEAEVLSALIEARQVSAKSGENTGTVGISRPLALGSAPDMEIPISPSDRQRNLRTGVGPRPRAECQP